MIKVDARVKARADLYLDERRLAMPLNRMRNQTRADFMPCD